MTKTEAIERLNQACMRLFGCTMTEATDKQAYKALCTVVRNGMYDRRRAFKRGYQEENRKQVFYMSMEFLVGTSLRNNLFRAEPLSPPKQLGKRSGSPLNCL